MDSEDNVVGVAQIINKSNVDRDDIESHMFTEQDMLVFRKYLVFCGIGITNAQLFQLSMQEYHCNRVRFSWCPTLGLFLYSRNIFYMNGHVHAHINSTIFSLLTHKWSLCRLFSIWYLHHDGEIVGLDTCFFTNHGSACAPQVGQSVSMHHLIVRFVFPLS